MTNKKATSPKAPRRQSSPSPLLRLVDWTIDPMEGGEVKLAFVAVIQPSDTQPCRSAGHCYLLGQDELLRLVEELKREMHPTRHSKVEVAPQIGEPPSDDEPSVSEPAGRSVLSAYGLFGN